MSVIEAEQLTFGYENSPELVFEKLSFRLDTAWKLGLIARNGKGKTTLLRLMAGEMEHGGSLRVPVETEYFPPEIRDKTRLGAEVAEELLPDFELWKVCRECNLLDLDTEILYRPFDTLSNGQQTKLLLAVLFSADNAFLLIDEPTNHLDNRARAAVGAYLRRKKGFLLVSHDRAFLDECVDHVMVMNRESMEIRQGNFSLWWEEKRNRDTMEMRENEKIKKEIGRLQTASRQAGAWADKVEATKIGHSPYDSRYDHVTRAYIGEKSRKMQMRRKNLERRLQDAQEEKKGLLKDVEETESLKLFPLEFHKEVLAEARECTLSYSGRAVAENLTFTIKQGECVFLTGKNGCGKSSIMKAILGGKQPKITRGMLKTAQGAVISYVPQDASFLRGSLTEYGEAAGIDVTVFLALLRKLDFSREQFFHPMEDYSAGQKKKVLLAASLCKRAHLYIWDEPLNYIDVFSRIQIQELVKKGGFTLLAAEHDLSFREGLGGRELLIDKQ